VVGVPIITAARDAARPSDGAVFAFGQDAAVKTWARFVSDPGTPSRP